MACRVCILIVLLVSLPLGGGAQVISDRLLKADQEPHTDQPGARRWSLGNPETFFDAMLTSGGHPWRNEIRRANLTRYPERET
jgi:hypothetical protein